MLMDASSVCACLTEPSVLVYILPGAVLSMCSSALVSGSIATSGVVSSKGEHMVQLCVSGAKQRVWNQPSHSVCVVHRLSVPVCEHAGHRAVA
jgi:hypothetical protein